MNLMTKPLTQTFHHPGDLQGRRVTVSDMHEENTVPTLILE